MTECAGMGWPNVVALAAFFFSIAFAVVGVAFAMMRGDR